MRNIAGTSGSFTEIFETHGNKLCFRKLIESNIKKIQLLLADISQIMLASQKMFSQQLNRFPVCFSTKSFGIRSTNFDQITLMMGILTLSTIYNLSLFAGPKRGRPQPGFSIFTCSVGRTDRPTDGGSSP